MRLTLVKTRWFGVQILFQRGWSLWHDHDWNAWTLFLGRALEEVEVDWSYTVLNKRWFLNRVPWHRLHRFRAPFGIMLILHGKQRQEHVAFDNNRMQQRQYLQKCIKQTNEELAC